MKPPYKPRSLTKYCLPIPSALTSLLPPSEFPSSLCNSIRIPVREGLVGKSNTQQTSKKLMDEVVKLSSTHLYSRKGRSLPSLLEQTRQAYIHWEDHFRQLGVHPLNLDKDEVIQQKRVVVDVKGYHSPFQVMTASSSTNHQNNKVKRVIKNQLNKNPPLSRYFCPILKTLAIKYFWGWEGDSQKWGENGSMRPFLQGDVSMTITLEDSLPFINITFVEMDKYY